MKRYDPRGLQVKASMPYHYIPVTELASENTGNTKCRWGVEHQELLFTSGRSAKWYNLCGQFSASYKAIILLNIWNELKMYVHTKNLHIFTTASFFSVKNCKQPDCLSILEWIKKLWYIYTMEYFSEIKEMSYPAMKLNRSLNAYC